MKKSFIIFALLFIALSLNAQSDLKTVKEFKNAVSAIERKIVNAKSTKEIEVAKLEMSKLKRKYVSNKKLLDGALYPKNFNSTFTELNTKITLNIAKISEKEGLKSQLSSLKGQIKVINRQMENLRNENNSLYQQLKLYKAGRSAGHSTVDSLNRLVVKLRRNLNDRDNLISQIIDSLFFDTSLKQVTFNDIEKREIGKKVKSTNILENIELMISDNIRFIKTGDLSGDDYIKMRENFENFNSKWSIFGNNLTNIYSRNKLKTRKLAEIDQLVAEWDDSFELHLWESITKLFESQKLIINSFTNSDEFNTVLNKFLDDEINNVNNRSDEEMSQYFEKFSMEIWDNRIAEYWVPYLMLKGQLNDQQLAQIEDKIDKWADSFSEGQNPLYMYGFILAILLTLIVVVFSLAFKKR